MVREHEMKKCEYCGKEYKGDKRTHYCSKECRYKMKLEVAKAWRIKEEKIETKKPKKKNEYETVKNNCTHEECLYRSKMSGMDVCDYLFITNERRGCKISECEHWKDKKVKRFYFGERDILVATAKKDW